MQTLHAKLYEVWFSRGSGFQVGPKFRLFEDARRYVEDHVRDASYAVRNPDGRWEMIVRRQAQNA
jgi:hypothetical protein